MVFRKFNIEMDGSDPFLISDEDINHDELTWDWHFEENAYRTKKVTIDQCKDILEVVVENRQIVDYVTKVCTIDIPNMGLKFNSLLIYFFQSVFSRMVKTSKVIQDLSTQGSYVEAKALLRTNFERAVLIEFFASNEDKISDYLEVKGNNNKSMLKKYSIKNLVTELKKDYEKYIYLCNFAHPNLYEEDVTPFEFEENFGILMNAYNYFQADELKLILFWNNNLLVEAFLSIFNYMKKDIAENKIDDNLKRVFKETNKIKFIQIKDYENLPKNKESSD